jgi:hypothetical protein
MLGIPDGSRRTLGFLAAATALVLQSGCGSMAMVVDQQYELYLKTLPKRHDEPLAQTLTWKHNYTVGKGSSERNWFTAEGKPLRSQSELKNVQLYAAQPSTSGWKTSELYAQQAREYRQKGQSGMAQAYQSASTVSAQTQIASERVATGIALSGAIQGLGAAALDYVIINSPTGAVKYVNDQGNGIIGNRAPEGSVLELFFRSRRIDGEDAKPAVIVMIWETTATLRDGDGRIWRSAASFKNHLLHSFSSGAPPVPEQLNQGQHVRIDPNTGLPMQNPEQYDSQELRKIISGGGNMEFGLTAMRAIEDIYEQMDLARATKKRRAR